MSPSTAASTVPSFTSASAAASSATSVTSSPGTPSTYCAEALVTATGVVDESLALKPAQMTPARASTNRMPKEMRNDLLRSFDPISRSATSQTLCAKVGAAAGGAAPRAAVCAVGEVVGAVTG